MSRNGRSSSQISIDNYPEHLNPFYEDDNHKRLRFWNLKKKASDKGRKSSFSIENLRDIWTFKSFSLKKKSSTLGVNKTSESPPLLRRQLNEPYEYNSFLSTRDRYSDTGASPNRNELNLSYRRPYRSSLQHIDATSETGSLSNAFNRNDMYRATTQSVGYLTPNFRRQHQTRLSQSSLSSTNPFESDMETNVDSISTNSRKSYRKKRRAPLPPPRSMVTNDVSATTIIGDNANDNIDNIDQYRSMVTNDVSATTIIGDNANDNIDIKSLTTEIEQFVNIRHKSLDNPEQPAVLNVKNLESWTSKSETNGKVKSNTIVAGGSENTKSSKYVDDTTVKPEETMSPSLQRDINKNSLCIDENRNYFLSGSLQNEKNKDQVTTDQKKKVLSVQNLGNINHHKEDETTNISKIVNEGVLSKTQKVLNEKDEVKVYKLQESNESFTGLTIKSVTSQNPEISEKNVLLKNKNSHNGEEKIQMPKIGLTDESSTQSIRDDADSRRQRIVIKASLSKTENNKIINEPVYRLPLSSSNELSPGQVTEEAVLKKCILQNSKISNGNNALFIEELPETTPSIAKHKALQSEVQASPMPKSSSPKNPQQKMVPSSVQKDGNTQVSQNTTIQHNGANVISTFKEDLLKNDEPCSTSTLRSVESKDVVVQPGKKKSVREVIESINRSQRMLNESIAKGTKVYSTPLFVDYKNSHSNELNSSNLKSTQQLKTKNITVNTVSLNEGSVDTQPNVFHKSKINKMVCEYRESSPTASNLDWNPLPKPKRTNNP